MIYDHWFQRHGTTFLERRKHTGLLFTLRMVRRVGGRFDQSSNASAFPKENQIYIEEVWELGENGVFKEKVNGTRGIIVQGKDISLVEFFGNNEVQDEEQEITQKPC